MKGQTMNKKVVIGAIAAGVLALAVMYTVVQKEMKDFEPDFEFDDFTDDEW